MKKEQRDKRKNEKEDYRERNSMVAVNIQAVSGQPGDGFKINIRGAGTNGNTAPVYVIDGVAGGDTQVEIHI